jgi:Methyltransferase domain
VSGTVPPSIAFRRRLARSSAAPIAALPVRLRDVVVHDARVLRTSASWLVTSREHTNYTYELTARNRTHLAWFVAAVSGAPVAEVRGYLGELDADVELREHVRRLTAASARRGLADPAARFGRRAGWYALVRALRPQHVVETGTDKGLGSCVLAAALLRNGTGRLTTIDINAAAGYLVSAPYDEVVDAVVGDSLAVLTELDRPVDLFLHDSDHTEAYETAELAAVAPRLNPGAYVLSDNAELTDALARWAEQTGRQFLFFDERPEGHWHPGGGIGIALPAVRAGAERTRTQA